MTGLKADLSAIPLAHLEKIKEVFQAYAAEEGLRPPVKQFFTDLAQLCLLEAARRAAGAPEVEITVRLATAEDLSLPEIGAMKRVFAHWREGFIRMKQPACAEFFNDLTILVDDLLHGVKASGKKLEKLFYGNAGIQSEEAQWEEG